MNKFYLFLIVISSISCKGVTKDSNPNEGNNMNGKIAFVSNRDGNHEIFMMNPDGSNIRRLTNNDSLDYSPSWAKDEDRIFFYSKRDGNPEIYSLEIENQQITRLTHHLANDVLPVASPKGDLILFMSDRELSIRNLFIMKSDGSEVRALTMNKYYEESPDWSPDGQKVIFTRQLRDPIDTSHAGNGEIHIMNADGSNIKRLTYKEGYDSGAKFSPDGKKIAFYGYAHEQWDIYIMNSDGSDLINLTNDRLECYSPDWSPGGNWLVFTAGKNDNYNLWKINIRTKERIQLTNTNGRNEGSDWR